MVVGALADLGVDNELVKEVMEHYGSYFGKVEVTINKIIKAGISSSFVYVEASDSKPVNYKELIETLDGIEHPEITGEIKEFTKKVYKTMAEAESHVHGTTLDKIHFHEVGAADAVADVIGASYLFHKLELNKSKVYGMPVALGGGRINSMHGKLSVPAPATLEILKNVPTFGGPVDKELTTPTGAALYVNMVNEFIKFYPLMSKKTVAYGAGKMELAHPNVFRIVKGVGEMEQENVSILETNVDDVSGEVLGHIFEGLIKRGARDVSIIPTITKKNRPGHLLRVIAKPQDTEQISEEIIRETGTLGVRVIPYAHRNIAHRKIVPMDVMIEGKPYKIDIKVGMIGEDVISVKPEYEDVKHVASLTGRRLKYVTDIAVQQFRNQSLNINTK
ncbi:MAG: nickel pincer cofactor biosynthesis protein LarC, partial [Methanobacterium sp.]|nr:nickel pincer cofactor biosynthesis protein LarC [Methanobacterium sp.]